MALLPCKDYIAPLLKVLAAHPDGLSGLDLAERTALQVGLEDVDRRDTIADGTPKYVVRIKQARYLLKKQNLVAPLESGMWVITDAGRQIVQGKSFPQKLSRKGIHTIPEPKVEQQEKAPIERLEDVITEIVSGVEEEVLIRLKSGSPNFFEHAVLRLLAAMGYSLDQKTYERTGGAGDGGIDGVLRSDRLGLERVYVQAKRWKGNVNPEEVRAFCGALTLKHANKGVILTTGVFSDAAISQLRSGPQAVRTIDGRELASLMVEYGVGVSRSKMFCIPSIDRDFFEE